MGDRPLRDCHLGDCLLGDCLLGILSLGESPGGVYLRKFCFPLWHYAVGHRPPGDGPGALHRGLSFWGGVSCGIVARAVVPGRIVPLGLAPYQPLPWVLVLGGNPLQDCLFSFCFSSGGCPGAPQV